MPIYTPPLRDMQFVLHELAGLDEIAALPGFGEATPDLVEQICQGGFRHLRAYLSRRLPRASVPQRLPRFYGDQNLIPLRLARSSWAMSYRLETK